MEHTPGPWNKDYIRHLLRYGAKNGYEYPGDSDADESLDYPDPYGGDPDLIAAAPDLLAALEAVEWGGLDAFDHPVICPSCSGHKDIGHGSGCTLAAAIRRARGEDTRGEGE